MFLQNIWVISNTNSLLMLFLLSINQLISQACYYLCSLRHLSKLGNIFFYILSIKLLNMSKAKQKQLQLLRQIKEKKEIQFKNALRKIIDSEQSLKISLDYAEQYLDRPLTQHLEEYSATHISRLIFQNQLKKAKVQIEKLPKMECRIEHFIAIMLKIMKFPFEKVPLYMVGLKDVFNEIVQQGKDAITYENIFKYTVGELVTMKQQQQNTQFQVRFEQNKKQDFLLHDNGIKRVLYSSDIKTAMTLDYRDNMIKLYDQDMKSLGKYSPRKDMHNGRCPTVIDFDYSEMTMRLGVILADSTIQSIHLPNYLHKTQAEFQQSTLNLLIFPTPVKMRRVYFIHMLNKFLTISQEDNQVYLYDMDKVRSKPEQVEEKVEIDSNDLTINHVLEVIALSTVCFVAGNEVTFYNETLAQKKFSKFAHHQIITHFKYSEETNSFYFVGRQEKCITIFTISRSNTFKIRTLQIGRIIKSFEIFPYFQTLIVTDDLHQMRLIHEPTKTFYQHQSLANIVKMKDEYLQVQRISKNQYFIFQTYVLIFSLDKIAIERQVEYNFLPYYHFDEKKDQLYISINGQLISFSLLYGQIRKNYSQDTSNIVKHKCFFISKSAPPFIIDQNNYLYEVYLKNEEIEGENRNYRKKIGSKDLIAYFYDQEMKCLMFINSNSAQLIRNQSNNNFNSINFIGFEISSKIVNCTFCKDTKQLTFMTSAQLIYQIKNFQNHFNKCFKFRFQRAQNDAQQRQIIQHEYCSHYQILILLNSKNQIVITQRLNISNYVLIKINDHLPYKLRNLTFTRFSFHLIKQKNQYYPSILLYDQTGFLFDIDLRKIITAKFMNTMKEQRNIRSFPSESYDVKQDFLHVDQLFIGLQTNKFKLVTGDYYVIKAHQKQIAIAAKIYLQIFSIITISKDGIIKLWNQKYTTLFVLKIPSLLKLLWNMQQIQSIKNEKSVAELKDIIRNHYSTKNSEKKAIQTINRHRKIKHYAQPVKVFKFSQQMPLQIQSKEVEDIVLKQQDYYKAYQTYRGLKMKMKANPELSNTIDFHPWRRRQQFTRIYEKASPPHKYTAKIPQDLMTLRTSLDMTQRSKKKPNLKAAQTLLPQLKAYEQQKPQSRKQSKSGNEKEDLENFESCLYIKTQRGRKKPNQLDKIDRQFFKKQIALQNHRFVPRQRREKVSSSIQLGQTMNTTINEQNRYDTIREIKSVFEQHNRQCVELGRGRLIEIPKIALIKDHL